LLLILCDVGHFKDLSCDILPHAMLCQRTDTQIIGVLSRVRRRVAVGGVAVNA